MTSSADGAGLLHLRAAGTSLLLDARGPGLPTVVTWGPDLGEASADELEVVADAAVPAVATSALDVPVPVSLLPERSAGYRGRPGLTGSRAGRDFSTAFRLDRVTSDGDSGLVVEASDAAARLSVRVELRLHPGGLLQLRTALRNDGGAPYALDELATVLPVPARAGELLDLTGRWLRERAPQRHPFVQGAFVREQRRGRTGFDASLVLAAGTPSFRNRSGEVWGVHLGWSGDSRLWAEQGSAGHAVLGAAELLGSGEVVLAPGAEHVTPWTYAAYSARGLDGIGDAFHDHLRARPHHPRSPRPVVVNTWEAVYFDHDLARLTALADVGAEVGAERFVLDDGWFRGRRDDTAGLGDWYVDETVWPDGLTPLISHVRARGLDFGLWVEPEMVNLDSDLHRAHPDWVLGVPGRLPPSWRGQQVLDLTVPEAWDHVLERLDALLSENDIAYLKWDHNRDLVEAADRDGRPAVHAQTLAVYRLLDVLRERHPGVEIESCSSGGARVDLGVLERTDRVWGSDANDALERQGIQRWTSLLLPPELVGSHVGPPHAHTTGRWAGLSFRVATALFGSFGFEWDLTATDADERERLRDAVATYTRLRPLLHGGRLVHGDVPDPSALLHGVVARDGRSAVFCYAQLTTSAYEVPAAVLLPGLDADLRYRVTPLPVAGGHEGVQRSAPPWWDAGSVVLTGRSLGVTGLRLPVLNPEQALLVELHAES
jgi:alpha-galactosidase